MTTLFSPIPALLPGSRYSLWPALSRGHREEREQGPEHVVIVELVLLPLPVPGFYFVLLIQEVLASVTESWLVSRAHHLSKAMCVAWRWAYSCPYGGRDPGLSVGVRDTDRMERQTQGHPISGLFLHLLSEQEVVSSNTTKDSDPFGMAGSPEVPQANGETLALPALESQAVGDRPVPLYLGSI